MKLIKLNTKWINYDKEAPKSEGYYLCLKRNDFTNIEGTINDIMYVSEFKFYRTEDGKITPRGDDAGRFLTNDGHIQFPDYFQTLPIVPTEDSNLQKELDKTKAELEQWKNYASDLERWAVRHRNSSIMEWSMMRPNKPGYYRANND